MNEQVPVKQSMAVMVALFGGYLIAACFYGLFALIGEYVSIYIYLGLVSVIEIVAIVLFDRWLRSTGARIFANL